MIKLYLDFDGVILNTIDVTYDMLAKRNITDGKEKDEFYRNLDWFDLINGCSEIENSVSNIKRLIKSDLYDICILTHIGAGSSELSAKRKYLKDKFGNIKVIGVKKGINKCDVVDCYNAILVDDYMNNLELWYEKGGIPIKFSDNGRKCKFMSIKNLGELVDRYEEIEKLLVVNE